MKDPKSTQEETTVAEQSQAPTPRTPRTINPFPVQEDEPTYEEPILKVEKILGPCGEEPCA